MTELADRSAPSPAGQSFLAPNWIAVRTPDTGLFHPEGLDHLAPAQPQGAEGDGPEGILARGSLVMELRHEPRDGAVNLIRLAERDPWPSALMIRADPRGGFRVILRQAERSQEFRLECAPLPGDLLRITYRWDAPGGTGWLSVHAPERALCWSLALDRPLPIFLRDIGRLARSPRVRIDPLVDFVAVAAGDMPLGPVPTLGPATMVETPHGPRTVDALVPGARVMADDGKPARVLWTGALSLPTVGSFAPVLVRAPYYGLGRDVMMAAGQGVRIEGSEIEYLFGLSRVAVEVGHLCDDRRVSATDPSARPLVQRYVQLVLDRDVPLKVSGLTVEAMPLGALSPPIFPRSVLATLPGGAASLPVRAAPEQRLKSFEARTYTRMRAA